MPACLQGFRALRNPIRLIGICAQTPPDFLAPRILQRACEAAQFVGLDLSFQPEDIALDGAFLGPGYGVPDAGTVAAIELAARTEALILDPVYTGKAMAGLIAHVRSRPLAQGRSDRLHPLRWRTRALRGRTRTARQSAHRRGGMRAPRRALIQLVQPWLLIAPTQVLLWAVIGAAIPLRGLAQPHALDLRQQSHLGRLRQLRSCVVRSVFLAGADQHADRGECRCLHRACAGTRRSTLVRRRRAGAKADDLVRSGALCRQRGRGRDDLALPDGSGYRPHHARAPCTRPADGRLVRQSRPLRLRSWA